MDLDQVLAGVEVEARSGANPQINGLEYDSRRVSSGALFVAMRGETVDGNQYIGAALQKGAAAILTDSAEAFTHWSAQDHVAIARVPHGRRAMALAAANLYGHPERRLAVSGVTGTNGKTTTAFLLEGLLQSAARKTVLVGTIEYHLGDQILPSPHTTPESRDLLDLFARGVEVGATEAVMEVSSHALEQGRNYGVPYDVAIFTNLTQDHLDYHGTMERYFAAKCRLFTADARQGASPAPRVAVVNVDDPYGVRLAGIASAQGSQVSTYGIEQGEYRAESIRFEPEGMRFDWSTPLGRWPVTTRLMGRVNIYNLLAAGAAALARGLAVEQVVAGMAELRPVPGRLESVHAGQPFTVLVDYAHTDDALRNLTALGREWVAARGGRVITMFGCGGDRDRSKRPLMGRAAAQGSDCVVITSDNPRSEKPEAILADIVLGLTTDERAAKGEIARNGLAERPCTYTMEPDRAKAIRLALGQAKAGDIVLLAGKGHEKTQTIGSQTIPFDDVAVATAVLNAMKVAGDFA